MHVDGENGSKIKITKLELEDELKVLCNSLKGKKNLDNIKVIGDLSAQTKKDDLLKVTLCNCTATRRKSFLS